MPDAGSGPIFSGASMYRTYIIRRSIAPEQALTPPARGLPHAAAGNPKVVPSASPVCAPPGTTDLPPPSQTVR